MSVNTLSPSLNERSTPQMVPVSKPVELTDRPDFKPENQSITDSVHKPEQVSSEQQKNLAADADKQPLNAKEANTANGEAQGKSLLESLEKMAQSSSQLTPLQVRKLEFSTAQESGRTVVKVIDKESEDVIRQIPSEEFIRVADKINDLSEQMNAVQGVLFDSKV
jgi:flagellar protein FlaG